MSSKKSLSRQKKSVTRIGERLAAYLKIKGWKNVDLSETTKIAPNTISEVLNGIYDPGAETLEKIILNTDISPGYLFTGEGPMTLTSSGASQQPTLSTDADPLDRELLQMTNHILSVRSSAARDALASNITYFYDAVRREMLLTGLQERFDEGLRQLFGSSISDVVREVDSVIPPRRAGPDPRKGVSPASEAETSSESILENEKALPRRHIAIPKAQ